MGLKIKTHTPTEDVRLGSSEKDTKAWSAGTRRRRPPVRPSSRRRLMSRSAILHSSTTCALVMVRSCVMGRAITPAGGRSRGATSCVSDGMMCAAGLLRYARLALPIFFSNSFIVAQICVLMGSYENRAARLSVAHARKHSEHPRVALSPHIILSKRESTHWRCAEAMVL
jgi:hypothetical protein